MRTGICWAPPQASPSTPAPARGGTKQVTENQYEQRENTGNTAEDVPQWLLDRQKEMMERAQGNSDTAAEGV